MTRIPRFGVASFMVCVASFSALTSWATEMGVVAETALLDPTVQRPSARDLGISPGILRTGQYNAITDVAGVAVGHMTLSKGTRVNTGATAILPHGGNLYRDRVPAGFHQGNGYGKFTGSTQVIELGELETPIILTNTLSVPQGMEAAISWTLKQPGNEDVRSVNAVVGETNDGFLNDIRGRHLRAEDIEKAIVSAKSGPVQQGSVGAGRGTISFGWKGGIGTSSRLLPKELGGFTLGVLVQTNYGGILRVDGAPVGTALDQYFMREVIDKGDADGSIIVIIATDAPLSDRNLKRLASRAMLAIGRTGSPVTNGSGDYIIAFSTHDSVRRSLDKTPSNGLANSQMSPLFQAAVESTEESILNALFKADTLRGHKGTVEAIDIDAVREILAKDP